MGQFFWAKQGVGEYPNKDFFQNQQGALHLCY